LIYISVYGYIKIPKNGNFVPVISKKEKERGSVAPEKGKIRYDALI
jgi:hypothetical protein